MTKATKPNPRNRPATQADVDRAYRKGIHAGTKHALRMILFLLIDKHAAPAEDVRQLALEINQLADHINHERLSWGYIDTVLKDNDVTVRLTDGDTDRR